MDLKLFIETFGKAGQKVFMIFNYVVVILIIQHFVLIAIIKHICEIFPGKQLIVIFTLVVWRYLLTNVKKSERWAKFVWPSQNTWTLYYKVAMKLLYRRHAVFKLWNKLSSAKPKLAKISQTFFFVLVFLANCLYVLQKFCRLFVLPEL